MKEHTAQKAQINRIFALLHDVLFLDRAHGVTSVENDPHTTFRADAQRKMVHEQTTRAAFVKVFTGLLEQRINSKFQVGLLVFELSGVLREGGTCAAVCLAFL